MDSNVITNNSLIWWILQRNIHPTMKIKLFNIAILMEDRPTQYFPPYSLQESIKWKRHRTAAVPPPVQSFRGMWLSRSLREKRRRQHIKVQFHYSFWSTELMGKQSLFLNFKHKATRSNSEQFFPIKVPHYSGLKKGFKVPHASSNSDTTLQIVELSLVLQVTTKR